MSWKPLLGLVWYLILTLLSELEATVGIGVDDEVDDGEVEIQVPIPSYISLSFSKSLFRSVVGPDHRAPSAHITSLLKQAH